MVGLPVVYNTPTHDLSVDYRRGCKHSQPRPSINLRTDSPILAALDRIPIDQSVSYHSIIPLIGGSMDTDGVVEYRSSQLEGAASESVVAGTHLSQQDPDVIRELDRILRQHVATTGSTVAPAGAGK
jgi:hypothetical protein